MRLRRLDKSCRQIWKRDEDLKIEREAKQANKQTELASN